MQASKILLVLMSPWMADARSWFNHFYSNNKVTITQTQIVTQWSTVKICPSSDAPLPLPTIAASSTIYSSASSMSASALINPPSSSAVQPSVTTMSIPVPTLSNSTLATKCGSQNGNVKGWCDEGHICTLTGDGMPYECWSTALYVMGQQYEPVRPCGDFEGWCSNQQVCHCPGWETIHPTRLTGPCKCVPPPPPPVCGAPNTGTCPDGKKCVNEQRAVGGPCVSDGGYGSGCPYELVYLCK